MYKFNLCIICIFLFFVFSADAKKDSSAPVLKGVVIHSSSSDMKKEGLDFTGVKVDESLGLDDDEIEAEIVDLMGRKITIELLNEINEKIRAYSVEKEVKLARVLLPSGQDVSKGTVQIIMILGHLGEVRVEGNEWFREDSIINELKIKEDKVLDIKKLDRDVTWLNYNPFRQIDAVLVEGQSEGQIDLILKTRDRRPVITFVGYDNSGNDATGLQRKTVGFLWGNAFGRGDQLSYQFRQGADGSDYSSHWIGYELSLPWQDRLDFNFARSETEVENGAIKTEGSVNFASVHYNRILDTWFLFNDQLPEASHETNFGIEYKEIGTDVIFGGQNQNIFPDSPEVFQLHFNYEVLYNVWFDGKTRWIFDAYYSPGDITNNNDDKLFSQSGAGGSDYEYYRLVFEHTQPFYRDGWEGYFRGLIQYTDDALLSSEQFSLGGINGVRGYNEGFLIGDKGEMVRFEIRSPYFPLLENIGLDGATDNIRALGFFDAGRVERLGRPGVAGFDEQAMSVGIGLRYEFGYNASLRADFAWNLDNNDEYSDSEQNAHVGLVIRW